ncbi:hypothetical protein COC42_16675 [Sphingomonas spermidinifaciens]|uniref:PilZ domain-containing protein n=1 Tax=Sphingomonas spermidinifaciens TaxID=1141889 RepID=A0A2A4B231_9SPHN|nr:PilZ domain-containing protein [Sphingomonas spermidinifaciens]PCD01744.1 hypothetical protein COC42_16675 [Sphingomonas spermidinifaciens]
MTLALRKTDFDSAPEDVVAERRHDTRQAIGRTGVLRLADGLPTTIAIADLTREGCRMVSPTLHKAGDIVMLGIAGVGSIEAEIVWQRGSEHGARFLRPLPPGSVTAAMSSKIEFGEDGVPVLPSLAVPSLKQAPRSRIATLALLAAFAWIPALGLFYATR